MLGHLDLEPEKTAARPFDHFAAEWLRLEVQLPSERGIAGALAPNSVRQREESLRVYLTPFFADKDVQEILRIPLIGVIPESEAVLQASNQGTPAVHPKGTNVAEAYLDVVARFLGEERPMRFVDYQKPGLFKRLLVGR